MSDQQKSTPILSVSTAQTTVFRQVIERIQDMLIGCNIVLIPSDDEIDETDNP